MTASRITKTRIMAAEKFCHHRNTFKHFKMSYNRKLPFYIVIIFCNIAVFTVFLIRQSSLGEHNKRLLSKTLLNGSACLSVLQMNAHFLYFLCRCGHIMDLQTVWWGSAERKGSGVSIRVSPPVYWRPLCPRASPSSGTSSSSMPLSASRAASEQWENLTEVLERHFRSSDGTQCVFYGV